MNPVILASASPRRRALLEQIGVAYLVEPADIDETPRTDETPEQYVQRIAADKSWQVWRAHNGQRWVLAADTSVVVDGEILGKPRDRDDAFAMLRRLSDRTHQVYSAVSLRGTHHDQALNITEVRFRALTDAEIEAYWHSGEPRDKAGAYAIQGLGAIFVAAINGSFSGVVGLPLFETAQLLRHAGFSIADLASSH